MKTIDKRYGGASVTDVLPHSSADWFLVTQIKSTTHLKPKQRGAARVLRLRRVGDRCVVPARPELLGVVRQLNHVISIVEVEQPIEGVRCLGARGSDSPSARVSSTTGQSSASDVGGPPGPEEPQVASTAALKEEDGMSLDLKSTLRDLIQRLRPDLDDDEAQKRAERAAGSVVTEPALSETQSEALKKIKRRFESTAH